MVYEAYSDSWISITNQSGLSQLGCGIDNEPDSISRNSGRKDCNIHKNEIVSSQTIALTSMSLPVFKSNFFMCLCRVFSI
jgi:hypothetical protein